VKKIDAAIDEWIKDIAPITALRKWFGHDPARWQEFRNRYTVPFGNRGDGRTRRQRLLQHPLLVGIAPTPPTLGATHHFDVVHLSALTTVVCVLAHPGPVAQKNGNEFPRPDRRGSRRASAHAYRQIADP
jgi:hypothetical protein